MIYIDIGGEGEQTSDMDDQGYRMTASWSGFASGRVMIVAGCCASSLCRLGISATVPTTGATVSPVYGRPVVATVK
jgi:hypothetical protein